MCNLLHARVVLRGDMIVPQKVQRAMHCQKAHLAHQAVAIFLRLLRCAVHGNDDIPHEDAPGFHIDHGRLRQGGKIAGGGALPIQIRKAEHVCFPIDVSAFAVQPAHGAGANERYLHLQRRCDALYRIKY